MAVFSNRATLSFNGTTTDSNLVTGEIVEVLNAAKTATSSCYTAGDTVTYVISIVNSGTSAFDSLTLTDDLGTYTFCEAERTPLTYTDGSLRYYVNGALAPTPAVTAGPPLSVSGITVPAGGNAILIYSAKLNAFAPPEEGATIVNTATIAGGGLSAPLVVSETVAACAVALPSISKSLCPTTVPENGRLTYTFVIANNGNTPINATDNAIVTDVFEPILSDVEVRYNGTIITEGVGYTYDTASGTFATTEGLIAVPAATFTQNCESGEWTVTPSTVTITVTGTV